MARKIEKTTIRLMIICSGIVLFYLILEARLWQEQILKNKSYNDAVADQSIRRIRKPAPRGRIFTSDNKLLADNYPLFNVIFHLREMRQPGRTKRTIEYMIAAADKVGRVINRKHKITKEKIETHINYTPALPMTIFKNLSTIELAKLSEMPVPINGMEITTIPQRRYKYKNTACHLLGFIRKDDPQKANDREDYFYYIPDERGKKGLEKVYDSSIPESIIKRRGLRGSPGSSLVTVDYRGFVYAVENSIPTIPGHDIVLTLNLKAQQIAEKLMEPYEGAFVLLNADNGALLSMVSTPGFDISRFNPRLSSKYWNELRSNPKKPLLNRALTGEYEPGSIIKPLITLSLLENGLSKNDLINCPGASYFGKKAKIRCAKRSGHGPIDVVTALKHSCNVFFIEQGRVLGLEKLAETLSIFGIGKKTGFPLQESSGLLPSRHSLYVMSGRKWNVFDTALISIGQGHIQVTPIQAALFTAAIANGGTLWRPYLLKKMLDPNGNTIYITRPFANAEINIKKEHLDVVKKGMYEVVQGRNGSGKKAKTPLITLYGKTGTAQKGKKPNIRKNTWFIGFGTHNKKTYAFAIFVENGQSGGRTCAPIAKKFFESWLKK